MKLASCDGCAVVVDTDKMEPIAYYMDEKTYRCPVCDTPEIVVKPEENNNNG